MGLFQNHRTGDGTYVCSPNQLGSPEITTHTQQQQQQEHIIQ